MKMTQANGTTGTIASASADLTKSVTLDTLILQHNREGFIMNNYVEAIPAYGRDYKSQSAVKGIGTREWIFRMRSRAST